MKFQRNARRYSMLLNIQSCTEKLLQNDDPGFVELSLERLNASSTVAPVVAEAREGGEGEATIALDADAVASADSHSAIAATTATTSTTDVVSSLCDALRINQSVRHVCVSGTFVRDCSPSQWNRVLHGIGFVPHLQELQIWCATLSVATLATVFVHAPWLHTVYLFQVRFRASSQDDYDAWSRAVQSHAHLTELRLGGIQMISTMNQVDQLEEGATNARVDHDMDLPEPFSLDSLLEALAETPQLRIFSLQLSLTPSSQAPVVSTRDAVAPFTAASLRRLVSNPTLTDVYLTRLGLQSSHLRALAEALESTHTNLRVLDVFGNPALDEALFLELAHALRSNASLETLVLPCHSSLNPPGQSTTLGLDCAQALADALTVNATLATLSLPRCLLCDAGVVALADALTVNTTLQHLEVGTVSEMTGAAQAALTTMLEQNYKLQRFILSPHTSTNSTNSTNAGTNSNVTKEQAFRDKIDYYMRLNAVGRGSLVGRHHTHDGDTEVDDSSLYHYNNRAEWVEMLIAVRDDLDCLYYFTTMNPTICHFAYSTAESIVEIIPPKLYNGQRRHSMLNATSVKRAQDAMRRASVL